MRQLIEKPEPQPDSAPPAHRLARLAGWGALALVFAGIAVALVIVLAGSVSPSGMTASAAIIPTPQLIEVPNEPLQPLPLHLDLDARKVELGRKLFADTRLSRDGTIACISCHQPQHGGADDQPLSKGIGGHLTAVNAPTVRNSRFSVAQFWDGRAAGLEAQVDGPLQNPNEMGATWPEVINRLEADPTYVAAAKSIYRGPLTPDVVRKDRKSVV